MPFLQRTNLKLHGEDHALFPGRFPKLLMNRAMLLCFASYEIHKLCPSWFMFHTLQKLRRGVGANAWSTFPCEIESRNISSTSMSSVLATCPLSVVLGNNNQQRSTRRRIDVSCVSGCSDRGPKAKTKAAQNGYKKGAGLTLMRIHLRYVTFQCAEHLSYGHFPTTQFAHEQQQCHFSRLLHCESSALFSRY
jgi:hypothetical protein